jgi:hypothetical protein
MQQYAELLALKYQKMKENEPCPPVPVKRIVPLEGQRPRLTQNSTTAARNRSQTPPPPKPLDPPAAHAQINDFAVHDFATPPGFAASRLRSGTPSFIRMSF